MSVCQGQELQNLVARAMRRVSLNLQESDFTKSNKGCIRELYGIIMPQFKALSKDNIFWPESAFSYKELDTREGLKNLNSVINKIRGSDTDQQSFFKDFLSAKVGAFGPGEILLYLLIDQIELGGATASTDFKVGSQDYEIKACVTEKINNVDYAYNFTTGGTMKSNPTYNEVIKMLSDFFGKRGSKTTVALLREFAFAPKTGVRMTNPQSKFFDPKDDKTEYDRIIDTYRNFIYNTYFKSKKIVFVRTLRNASISGLSNIGEIIAVKEVMPEDISIYEVTAGVIKPRIRL